MARLCRIVPTPQQRGARRRGKSRKRDDRQQRQQRNARKDGWKVIQRKRTFALKDLHRFKPERGHRDSDGPGKLLQNAAERRGAAQLSGGHIAIAQGIDAGELKRPRQPPQEQQNHHP